jgi:hypothetical protein
MDHQDDYAFPLVLALAQLAVATGMRDRAARLFGALPREAALGLLEPGFSRPGGLPAELDALRVALGDNAFTRAFAEGQRMSLEQALAYGLREVATRFGSSRRAKAS